MKPRRDITLGEMQDECKRRSKSEFPCDGCDYRDTCVECSNRKFIPRDWDLTDPPRFTEAQMAFFRGLRGLGVVKLDTCVRNGQPTAFDASGNIFYYEFLDNVEFPLDLAELLGKDGAE